MNRTLNNWYGAKAGYGNDNYSRFTRARSSKSQQRTPSLSNSQKSFNSQNVSVALSEKLEKNPYVTTQTFEEFVARKEKGRRHLFKIRSQGDDFQVY